LVDINSITDYVSPTSITMEWWPKAQRLEWSGEVKGMPEYSIHGRQTAILNIVYLEVEKSYSSPSLRIAYSSDIKLEKRYELNAVGNDILFIVSIASKEVLPKFAICYFDMEHTIHNLKLLEVKDEEPSMEYARSLFTSKKDEILSEKYRESQL
jgi:hypothetical protein